MSGLLALLDDVAAIARLAAASLDDITGQASMAGAKAASVVIDDAAVTPRYVHGIAPARELPLIWRITRGSLRNKLIYLLPVALLLSGLAPWLITPLLMLGGTYLSLEGAEKIVHALGPGHGKAEEQVAGAVALEEQKARGAIRTDFILSAEIMTIALAAIPHETIWKEALVLAVVAIGITALVYGSVALIVKADDFGLFLARRGRSGAVRASGRVIVRAMPHALQLLSTIGTAAMLWVGGAILLHGSADLGLGGPAALAHDIGAMVAAPLPEPLAAAGMWLGEAAAGGVLGLGVGLVLLPLVQKIATPLARNAARGVRRLMGR